MTSRTSRSFVRRRLILSTALAGGMLGGATAAHAQLPTNADASVVAGTATISNPTPTTLRVELDANRTIINWTRFDVPAGNGAGFFDCRGGTCAVQPGRIAVLNRDLSGNLSQIDGAITSDPNVDVYLINTNGILFGTGANVNVGGLVASTLDLADADFLDGGSLGFASNTIAGVDVSTGASLIAGQSSLVLVGAYVNIASATTTTAAGDLAIVAAQDVSMSFGGGSPMSITIAGGTPIANAVTVGGTVAGRNIYVAMAAPNTVMNALLNVTGTLTATTATATDRGVVLAAGTNAIGVTIAPGAGTGGAVRLTASGAVTANQSVITANADVEARASDDVTLADVTAAGDVSLDAGTGDLDVQGMLGVSGNYAATAASFLGNSLTPLLGAASDVTIVDTAGGLNMGVLTAPGTISITALNGGTLNVNGALTSTSETIQLATQGGGNILLGANVGATLVDLNSSGGISQNAGAITAGQLAVRAVGNAVLNQAGNDVATVAADITGAGSFQLLVNRASGALTVGTVGALSGITTNGGNIVLIHGTADTPTLRWLTVAAPINSNGGNIQLRAADNIAINAAVSTDDPGAAGLQGRLELIAFGGDTTGTISQTAPITADSLLVRFSATSALTNALNEINLIAAAAQTPGAGFAYRDASGFAIAALADPDGGGAFNAQSGLSAGDLFLQAGGAIIQSGGVVTATSFGVRGTSATLTGNNDVGTLAAEMTAGFSFSDVNGLTVGSVAGFGGLASASGITGGSGPVSVTAAGDLTVGDAITTTGDTVLTANGAGSDIFVDAAVSGDDVTLTSGGNILVGATGAVAATTDATLDADGNLTVRNLSAGRDAALTAGGTLDLVNTATVTDDMILTAADFAGVALTAPGAGDDLKINDTAGGLVLGAPLTVPGSLSINALGGGQLTVNGALASTNENILLGTAGGGGIVLAADLTTGGTGGVMLDGSGTIAQNAGRISTGQLSGHSVGGTALTSATNAIAALGTFTNTGGGGFTLVNGAALVVNGAVSAGGDLSIDSQGLDFTGQTLSGTNVTLDANGFALVGGSVDAGNDAILTGATIDIASVDAGHDASLSATGALDAGSVAAGNDATLTGTTIDADSVAATAGDATFNGAVQITGATNVTAGDEALFNGPVDGAGSLVVTAGTTVFLANVGSGTRLDALTVNGATILRAGNMLANAITLDALTVDAPAGTVTLDAGSGALDIDGAVNAATADLHNLVLAGASIDLADVGTAGRFASVSVNGPARLAGNVTAQNAVTFTDALTVTGTGLRSVTAGSASFQGVASETPGVSGLFVNVGGAATFAGSIGGAGALGQLGVRANSASFAGTNFVGTLAAELATGNLAFANGTSLVIGTVGTINGVRATAGDVDLAVTGGLSSTALGTITSGRDVALDVTGAIALTAAVSAGDDAVLRAGTSIATAGISTGSGADAGGAGDTLYGGPLTGGDIDFAGNGVVIAGEARATGAASDIRINGGAAGIGDAGTDLDLRAGGNVALTGAARGRDIAVQAGGTIDTASLSAEDDVVLRATGAIATAAIASGGGSEAAGAGDTLHGGPITGGDIDIAGNGVVIAGQAVANGATSDVRVDGGAAGIGNAATDLDLRAGGNVALTGAARGRDIALRAGAAITAAAMTAEDDLVLRADGAIATGALASGGGADTAGAGDALEGSALAGGDTVITGNGIVFAGLVRATGAASDIVVDGGASGIGHGAQDLNLGAGGNVALTGEARGLDVAINAGGNVSTGAVRARDDIALRAVGSLSTGALASGVGVDALAAADTAGGADTLLAPTALTGNDIDLAAASIAGGAANATGTGSDLRARTSGGALALAGGTVGGAATLTQAGSGNLTLSGALTVAGNVTITTANIADLNAIASQDGDIAVTASDAELRGPISVGAARSVILTNSGGLGITRLGAAQAGAGFILTEAELDRISAGTLTIQSGTRDILFGAHGFADGTGSARINLLTTGRVDFTGAVSTAQAGTNRIVQIGGTAADTGLASLITVNGTAGGRLNMANSRLVLRAQSIGAGQADFLGEVGAGAGGTPIGADEAGTAFVGNPASRLFIPTAPTNANLITAYSLAVTYQNFALFQNSAPPGAPFPAGVEIGAGGLSATLALNPTGPQNAFALFGEINGLQGAQAALLGANVIVLNANVDGDSSRINGCLIGSSGGCLNSNLATPRINMFDSAQADVLSAGEELAIIIDPLVGSNNEALFGGLGAAPDDDDEDEDDDDEGDGEAGARRDANPGSNRP